MEEYNTKLKDQLAMAEQHIVEEQKEEVLHEDDVHEDLGTRLLPSSSLDHKVETKVEIPEIDAVPISERR